MEYTKQVLPTVTGICYVPKNYLSFNQINASLIRSSIIIVFILCKYRAVKRDRQVKRIDYLYDSSNLQSFHIKYHWFPNPFCAPQSGHSHVIPLQDIPQKFSFIQFWHMWNPHLQCQQKGDFPPQGWQSCSFLLRRLFLYLSFLENSFIVEKLQFGSLFLILMIL